MCGMYARCGGGVWVGGKGESTGLPRSVQQGPAPVPAGFLGREVALARPVISPAAFQLPTFSCVNF